MAEPLRSSDESSEEQAKLPNLRIIEGGGQTTPPRKGHLTPVSQDPYDKNDTGPVGGPDLQALERGSQSTPNNKKSLKSIKSSDKDSETQSKNDLGATAGETAGIMAGAEESDQLGKGFTSAGKSSRGGKILTVLFAGRRKFAVGGGIGGLVLVIALMFGSILPLELVHIEEALLGYEAKIEQRFEKKAAQKLMQKMVCRAMPKGCPGDNDPEDEKTTAEAEDPQAVADGEKLTEDMDNFDFTNPTVEQGLADQGIKVMTTDGEFDGLEDSQGVDITEDIGTNAAIFDDVETALPEWDIGQEQTFRPEMVDQAGSSFDVLPDTTTDDAQQTIEDEDLNGANNTQYQEAAAENNEQQPDKNATQVDQNQYSDESGQSGEMNEILKDVNADIAAGDDEEEILTNTEGKFNLGSSLLISTIITDICSIKNATDSASKSRVPTIQTLLIRHGTTLISLADQLKSGKMTSGEVNQTMKLYNGDSSAAPQPNGQPAEASLPFTSSAAWQRATGGVVSSSTPDMDDSVRPAANAGSKIVDDINALVNPLGGNLVCRLVTSWVGGVIQGFAGVAQFIADDSTFGFAEGATIAAVSGFQAMLKYTLIPSIIKYFTPIGIDGREDSVQQINNSDAGLNLAFGDYSRRLGGNPVSNPQADTLSAAANKDALAAESQLPWTERTFAISNPYSLASRLFDNLPFGFSNTIASIENYMTHFPQAILHGLASVTLAHSALAAQPAANPGTTYNITQYAFTDSETNKYDPVLNEQYLFSTISFDGQSARRIDMLGNPNTYTDSPSGDVDKSGNPVTTDLLHCYVDSYTQIEEAGPTDSNFNPNAPAADDPGADQNCGAVGMYDYAGEAPNDVDMPDNQTAVAIYCQDLTGDASDTDDGTNTACDSAVAPQVNDDVGHYRQYLLDLHVMNDYESLTTND